MISIITPTYNRKDMLREALDSILMQDYKDIEIIIIDDCSEDGTDFMIATEFNRDNIHYYKNKENMGPGFNRNFGFNKSKGEYVIFMDDDDYYVDSNFFQKAINRYYEYKSKNDNIAFVTANSFVEYVSLGKRQKADIGIDGYIDGIEFLLNLKIKYNKPQSTFTTLFNRKILEQADLMNMKMVNDYAIYLRALLFGDAYILKDVIGVYRIHDFNISANIKKDFLLENFEERKWVMERLKNKTENKLSERWWRIQMVTLVKYYLFGTNPNYKDGYDVISYSLKSSNFSLSLWMLIIGMFFLYKYILFVKKILKKLFNKGFRS